MVIVRTAQGFVKGRLHRGDVTYFAFKGIPYARPPLGELRFKAPEPPESWSGIRDAGEHGPVCPQYNERLDRIDTGSEDCLYLNVYSKAVQPPRPLPVMVWIHGGSFFTGSGNSDFYGPEFFMAHDMVLVTFNYRLEVFGFLCLDTEDVPGNAGLKDQVAALRWVKSNIAAFGGDPDNITVFGCSAGSAATSYHLLSRMSRGLFHRAICQSGVCLHEWAYNLHARERAFQLGKLLGKDTEDPTELVGFLRRMPSDLLVNVALPRLKHDRVDLADSISFGPVIEKEYSNIEKFISEAPYDIVRRGDVAKVPILLGYTSGEGIEVGRNIAYIAPHYSTVGSIVPRELKLKLSQEELETLDKKIRKHYFGTKDIDKSMLREACEFETYRFFGYNILRFARYHLKHTAKPVYVYKFCAETERNFYKKKYKIDFKGVCHADDLAYFFNVTNMDIPLTEDSKPIIKQVVEMWYNFASVSNPTPTNSSIQWKPFTEKERSCLVIDTPMMLVTDVDRRHIRFWEKIYNEEDISEIINNQKSYDVKYKLN
ncbi:juvenile hormone esterase-like isoform X2 [Aricia agestis]|nr:juvenile hormone esterase-like isoform X2 [Aricia agestis]XP_041988352.1 juvenile hormone esterase-like isoform X2 [Aricia agestis]XP_041988353.1 juvenile hormone esterase-like isoform X2 [Aricia agestis]